MKSIYDKEKITKLLKDFYIVTGQRIGLFDSNFNIISEYPEPCCEFCEHIRKSTNGYNACIQSDKRFLVQASKGQTVCARCHAGLLEVCVPIIDEMGISGYIMFGQLLLDKDIDRQLENIKQITTQYFEASDFESKKNSLRRISQEYLSSVENIMTACISYTNLNQLINATKTGLWGQIDYYLERNYTTNFTLEEMAADLGVSISSICKTAKANSNKTIHQLLMLKRVSKAKYLLKSTSLNISEVSMHVGMQDYNYFTKIFKKVEGVAPSAYRKSLQN